MSVTQVMANDLTTSETLALLAKRRRRLLLQSVRDSSTLLTMPELAKRIRDREYDDPSPRDLTSVRLSLYHDHLPKLEEAGVVEYNENEGTVRHGRNFEILVELLEKVGEEELPSSDQ